MWKQPNSPMRSFTRDVAFVAIGAVIILIPAIVNGFPFVLPDTGTYIRSAFQGYVPVDRPFWYGLFMRVTSLGGNTFWGIVAGQALLCAYYIQRIMKMFVVGSRIHLVTLGVITVLTACTGIGYFAGQLIPDIFTAIGILAMAFFLVRRKSHAGGIGDLLVALLCCWVHLSNMLIIPLCGVLLLLLIRRAFEDVIRRCWFRLGVITFLTWFGAGMGNLVVDGRYYISGGGQAFLIARLLDAGILRPWLVEHCAEGGYRLCKHIDDLPETSVQFLWEDSISPMYKEGGWTATKTEYERIVREVMSEPRYVFRFIQEGALSTGRLILKSGVCSALVNPDYRRPNSPPYVMIANTIPKALPSYLSSMQNGGRGELDMTIPDRANAIAMVLALAFALVMLVAGGKVPSGLGVRPLVLFVLGSILIDCAVSASLSIADDRYLSRVSWLLPLFIVGMMTARLSSRAAPRNAVGKV
jgi:hypothetical protein